MQGRVLTRHPGMLAAGSKRLQARAQLTVKRFMGFCRDRLMGVLSFGNAALKHAVRSAKVKSSPVPSSGPGDMQSLVAVCMVIGAAKMVCVVNALCAPPAAAVC